MDAGLQPTTHVIASRLSLYAHAGDLQSATQVFGELSLLVEDARKRVRQDGAAEHVHYPQLWNAAGVLEVAGGRRPRLPEDVLVEAGRNLNVAKTFEKQNPK